MLANRLYKTDIEGLRYEVYNAKPAMENITFLKQVHSSIVVDKFDQCREADGFVIESKQNRQFAIVTADCVPVVAVGLKGVAFVHAGWKGIRDNVLSPQNIGRIEPYHFFIGPHIEQCCYEVGKEFQNHFPQSQAFVTKDKKLYFSLSQQLKSQLENDFQGCTISESHICTHCRPDFHSYRRDKTERRNWNILYY